MSDMFVFLGGAAVAGFSIGAGIAGLCKVVRRLRTRRERFRFLA